MIWLNPRRVTLGGIELTHVNAVTLGRSADRLVVEYSDTGVHVAYADVPEQRVSVTIERVVVSDEDAPAEPGDAASLIFRTAPSASEAQVRQISVDVVVTSISHDLTSKRGLVQKIGCIAMSSDGDKDPVTETPLEGGS